MFIIIPRSWLGSALGLLVIKNERIEIPKKVSLQSEQNIVCAKKAKLSKFVRKYVKSGEKHSKTIAFIMRQQFCLDFLLIRENYVTIFYLFRLMSCLLLH